MGGTVIPFRRRTPDPGDDGGFVEVTRLRDQAEALVVKALLDAHGIRAALRTHVAPSVHPFTVGDQGEVRVLVPPESLADARRLLGRRRSEPGTR